MSSSSTSLGPPPPYSATPNALPAPLPSAALQREVSALFEATSAEQRRQLLAAMKAHVAGVEAALRNDLKNAQDALAALQAKVYSEGSVTSSMGSPVAKGKDGPVLSDGSEVRFAKVAQQIQQLKGSIDALWSSLGQLSMKISNVESLLDR